MKINANLLRMYLRKYKVSLSIFADSMSLARIELENMLLQNVIEFDEEQAERFLQLVGANDAVKMMCLSIGEGQALARICYANTH